MNALVVQEREWIAPYVAEERGVAVDGGERGEEA